MEFTVNVEYLLAKNRLFGPAIFSILKPYRYSYLFLAARLEPERTHGSISCVHYVPGTPLVMCLDI